MPHPCAFVTEGMEHFEACQMAEAAYAADKVLGEAPAGTVATLKEVLVNNAPAITERLNAAMVKIGEWVEAGEELAAEQAPLLVKEILYWGIADAAFWVVLGVFCLLCLPVVAIYLGRSKTMPEGKRCMGMALEEKGSSFDCAVAWVGGIVLPIIGFLIICGNIMNLLKPIVAPRLYLIEYFRQLAE